MTNRLKFHERLIGIEQSNVLNRSLADKPLSGCMLPISSLNFAPTKKPSRTPVLRIGA